MKSIIKLGFYVSVFIYGCYTSWKYINTTDATSSSDNEELNNPSKKQKRQKWRKFKFEKNQSFLLRYIQYFERSVLQNKIPKPIPKHRQQYLNEIQIKRIHVKINKMVEESLLE